MSTSPPATDDELFGTESTLVSAPSSHHDEDLELLYTCPICWDLMVDPVTLICGHSFCKLCVVKWFHRPVPPKCPKCMVRYLPDYARRQIFTNITLRETIQTLFPTQYAEREKASAESKDEILALQQHAYPPAQLRQPNFLDRFFLQIDRVALRWGVYRHIDQCLTATTIFVATVVVLILIAVAIQRDTFGIRTYFLGSAAYRIPWPYDKPIEKFSVRELRKFIFRYGTAAEKRDNTTCREKQCFFNYARLITERIFVVEPYSVSERIVVWCDLWLEFWRRRLNVFEAVILNMGDALQKLVDEVGNVLEASGNGVLNGNSDAFDSVKAMGQVLMDQVGLNSMPMRLLRELVARLQQH